MKLKKLISGILCTAMIASSVLIGVNVNAAEELPFNDVPDTWYTEAVAEVYREGIMKGKTDVTFDPTANITRAEVVTAFSRVAIAKTTGMGEKLPFNDTVPGQWYSDSVGWAAESGIVTGRGDGRFSPADNITRAELASILTKFVKYMEIDLPDISNDRFTDEDTFDSWMVEPIDSVRRSGLMQGSYGKFNPRGNATRAEIAQVIKNLLPDVSRTAIVENGKSDYVIVADLENEGAKDAAKRLAYQIWYTTGAEIDVVDDGTAVAAKEIVIGDARSSGIDKTNLDGNGYEIKISDKKVFIGSADAEGLYRGTVHFALTCSSNDDVRFTDKSSVRSEREYAIGKLTVNGNDISKFTVYYPANGSEKTVKGAEELVNYIELACGVKLPMSTGTPGSYAIIVDETPVVVKDSVNKNEDNFTVTVEGTKIRLQGAPERGVIYACYDFLEDVIGWVFLSTTQDYIEPVEELDIKNMSYTESPVYAVRDNYGNVPSDKFRDYSWPSANGIHTFASLAPDYCAQYVNQPCLLDEAVYDQVIENVFKALEKKPESRMISVSVNDVAEWCTCDKCTEAIAKENATDYLLRFVNRVAEEIENRGYTDIMVHTFAYEDNVEPPINVRPRDNVMVQFCPITACNVHPITATCNAGASSDYVGKYIAQWAELGCHLYMWTYHGNFSNPVPHADFKYETMAGDLAYFADCGSLGSFTQLTSEASDTLNDFSNLRIYLLSELLWDPYMSEEEYYGHIKKFMKGYFGDGWEMLYDVLMEVQEGDTRCHRIFDASTDRMMQYRFGFDLDDMLKQFDEAELLAETKAVWENIDRNQTHFDIMHVGIKFEEAIKNGDDDSIQDMCAFVQDKMLAHGSMYGSENRLYPNIPYGEHQWNPLKWKGELDQPYYVTKYQNVTVPYPEDPVDIRTPFR